LKNILFILGTRPEAIKCAPLIREFRKNGDLFSLSVCVTAQHRQMLDQVLDFFQIKPDYDLNIMKPGQSLCEVTVNALRGIEGVVEDVKPDLLFIQGDTTTVLAGAIAGYYKQVKIAHLEAGLRSGNRYSPFPEEGNRILAGHLADYHFAPTERAVLNLAEEGISENVWNVGNTVIDALLLGLDLIKDRGDDDFFDHFKFVDFHNKIILVTGHRRESFGGPFENICYALKEIADRHSDVEIVYPVHLNPNVKNPVNRILTGHPRIHLIEPLEYPFIIWLMSKSYVVLTDSGGIQEEAPTLGKPVLVMRDVTERMEGVESGTAVLVGTDKQVIVQNAERLLINKADYDKMAHAVNPYGDGKTSRRIVGILTKVFHGLPPAPKLQQGLKNA
jgi:UDP-N-acetylglucosamine 2-epimerase (non-hydrolysing)